MPFHPGGEIITAYHGLDATDVFFALHPSTAQHWLRKFEVTSSSRQKFETQSCSHQTSKLNAEFRKLRQKIEQLGLLKDDRVEYHVGQLLATLLILGLATGLLILRPELWLVSALLVALFLQQVGWLAHDYHHLPLFNSPTINYLCTGIILGNVMEGFSGVWWKSRHNAHHAVTNVLFQDPDLDHLPLFVWDVKEVKALPTFSSLRHTLKYQAYYLLPFLMLLRLIWEVQSFIFVFRMPFSRKALYRKLAVVECASLCFHWVLKLLFCYSLVPQGSRVSYLFVVELVAGFLQGIIVFFNHYESHHSPSLSQSFAAMQVLSTRNISHSSIIDWLSGSMSYQIEHHLFPMAPRYHLPHISVHVQKFCEDNALPYRCEPFFLGWKRIILHLEKVSQFL